MPRHSLTSSGGRPRDRAGRKTDRQTHTKAVSGALGRKRGDSSVRCGALRWVVEMIAAQGGKETRRGSRVATGAPLKAKPQPGLPHRNVRSGTFLCKRRPLPWARARAPGLGFPALPPCGGAARCQTPAPGAGRGGGGRGSGVGARDRARFPTGSPAGAGRGRPARARHCLPGGRWGRPPSLPAPRTL